MFDFYSETKQMCLCRKFNDSNHLSFAFRLDSKPEEFKDESKYNTTLLGNDMNYMKMIPVLSTKKQFDKCRFFFVFRQRTVSLLHLGNGKEFPLIKVNCPGEAFLDQGFVTG